MNKPTSKFMYLNKIFTVSFSWEDVKQSQKGINYKMFLPCGDNFSIFLCSPKTGVIDGSVI